MFMRRLCLLYYAAMLLSTVVPSTDCCSSNLFGRRRSSPVGTSRQRIASGTPSAVTSIRNIAAPSTSPTTDQSGGVTSAGATAEPTLQRSDAVHIHYDSTLEAIGQKCEHELDEHYCLNGGKCLSVVIGAYPIPTCQCADGFLGTRCEHKYLENSYREVAAMNLRITRASIEVASLVVILVMALLLFLFFLYKKALGYL